MIRWPATILVATAPVNLHLSFDRLAGIVREQLGADPRSDTLIVFHNRARTHVKLLWHDGTGYCLLYKRLDRGTYRIPLAIPPGAQQVSVSARELALVLEGINEATLRAARRSVRPTRGVRVTKEAIETSKTDHGTLRAGEGAVYVHSS